MVPFAELMARFCKRIIRDEPELDTHLKPKHLDVSALDTPTLALANAAREVLRIGDAMEQMMEGLKRSCTASRVKRRCASWRMTLTCSTPRLSFIWRECQRRAGGGGVPPVGGDY